MSCSYQDSHGTPAVSQSYLSRATSRVRGFFKWIPTSKQDLINSQQRVLQAVVRRSHYESTFVPVLDGRKMHSIRVYQSTNAGTPTHNNTAGVAVASNNQAQVGEDKPILVLCHGFGTGAAIWAHIADDLAQHYEVHSVDLTGCGLSSRLPQDKFTDHGHAEATYVADLEAFLNNNQRIGPSRRVTLVGHSFGGMVAGAFALKNPSRLDRLVLVSPVGLPDLREEGRPELSRLPVWGRALVHTARKLWTWGATPQSVVRLAGPYGPKLVNRYVTRRFTDGVHKDSVKDYMYHLSAKRSTSETAITRMLAPGIYAHDPLGPRLRHLQVPTVFIYGSHDWMDQSAGQAVVDNHVNTAVPMRLIITPHAGHNVFLDNPQTFVTQFLSSLQEISVEAQATRDATSQHHVSVVQRGGDVAGSGGGSSVGANGHNQTMVKSPTGVQSDTLDSVQHSEQHHGAVSMVANHETINVSV